jgi:chromosome partitioning protein
MKTLAVANAKGGAGKTSTSVHLATGLALEGYRVLLVDLDPQHNTTLWLVGKANATPELPGAFEPLPT